MIDDRYNPSNPRHRELMLACCANGEHTQNAWFVRVWFATSAQPRTVARFNDREAAFREARAYLSDARAVWVNDIIVKA